MRTLFTAVAAVLALGCAAAPASAQPRDYIPSGRYLIAANLTYECIVVAGNDVNMAPCYTPGAMWTVESVGDGSDQVFIRQGDVCLSDVVDVNNGNDVSALPCADTPDKRWHFAAFAGQGFKIVAAQDRVAVVQPPLDYETTNFIRVLPEQGVASEFWGLYPV